MSARTYQVLRARLATMAPRSFFKGGARAGKESNIVYARHVRESAHVAIMLLFMAADYIREPRDVFVL